jgi:hypothetical protein
MDRNFSRRNREDQPTVARVNRLQTEQLRDEPTISIGVLAVHD